MKGLIMTSMCWRVTKRILSSVCPSRTAMVMSSVWHRLVYYLSYTYYIIKWYTFTARLVLTEIHKSTLLHYFRLVKSEDNSIFKRFKILEHPTNVSPIDSRNSFFHSCNTDSFILNISLFFFLALQPIWNLSLLY